jgi:caspase domain-containing protein
MSGKYALIIGNTEYIDPGLAQLTAPGRDAEDFARVLKDPNICAFDEVNVLFNQVSSTVLEGIDEFFDQKRSDDLLVLFFSGHGVRDEQGSLYLAVRNTIRSRLRSTAIKSDYIREVMDQSRSRRQILILDCCNSGAFAQGTKAEVGGTMGLVSAFQGYGRYVLTATDATQFAWEGNMVIGKTDNSLFTHFLVKGLEGEADNDGNGKITVDELYDYAFEQIVRVTPKQKPNKSATKQEGDIILRQITRIEDIKPLSLPDELVEATVDSRTFVREGAVQELEKLLKGKNLGLARSAREALERMAREDDSYQVRQATTQALAPMLQTERPATQPPISERLLAQEVEEPINSEQAPAEPEKDAETQPLATLIEAEQSLQGQSLDKEYLGQKKRLTDLRAFISHQPIFSLAVAVLVIGLSLAIAGYYRFQNTLQPPTLTLTSTATEGLSPTGTATLKRPTQTPQRSTSPVVDSYVYLDVSLANMYSGPGLGYYVVEQPILRRGDKLTLIARNPSSFWFLCKASDGTLGWLYLEWLELPSDPSEIPTAATIPAAPPAPTHRPRQCTPAFEPSLCAPQVYDPNTCTCR